MKSGATLHAIVVVATAALALPAFSASIVRAAEIEGRAKPVDGDSFNVEIRIYGIDAPELNQRCKDASGADYPCGRVAAEAMAALLKGKTVVCEKKDQDKRRGRPVAICVADGVDVGGELVNRGLAVAYRQYSDRYAPNEEQARAAKLGLWSGTFEMPWDYRRRMEAEKARPVAATASDSCPPPKALSSDCAIKGNISGKKGKARIYHMPGSRAYDQVSIDPAKGERYFCTEEEASACGWRSVKGP